MNAGSLAKSARAFILAFGLIAVSTVIAAAQDVPVSLGAAATIPFSAWYVAPPTGQATLGGHSFNLSGGNLLQLPTASGTSQSYAGSYPNVTAVYLLLNTFNTSWWYQGAVVGTVVLTYSDGTTQSTDLTVGGNIREWRVGAAGTVNTVTDTATTLQAYSTQVWSGTAQATMGGGAAVIDMLTIKPLTTGKTLTSVTVNYTNTFGALRINLAGLTVDDVAPAPPAPTPTPTTCEPKHTNDGHKAETAKHLKHCDDADKSDGKADVEKGDQPAAFQRLDD
jgi:hypothetical protein